MCDLREERKKLGEGEVAKSNKPPGPLLDGNCCGLACMVPFATEITFKKLDPDTQWPGIRILVIQHDLFVDSKLLSFVAYTHYIRGSYPKLKKI